MKKGKITKVEEYAMKAMVDDGMNAEDIAQTLDRSLHFVNKYAIIKEPSVDEDVSPEPERPKSKFITKTGSGNDGIVVMTKEASESGDVKQMVPRNSSESIHKIYNG